MTSNELSHQEQLNISYYIASIYQQARQMDINNFRYFCINRLNCIISFDGALWFDRRDHNLAFTNLDTFTYQLPDHFIENYNEYISKDNLNEDPVGKYGIENPNVTFTFEDIFENEEEFHQSDLYKHHCKKFNQTDVLTSLNVSKCTKKYQAIALYKFNADNVFSNKDKVIKSILDPHFAEAMTMNILANFDRKCDSNDIYRAITDVHGSILEAEDNFIDKLKAHNNSNIDEIDLPKLINGKTITYELSDGTEITLQLQDTLVLIELPKVVKLSKLLTPKQLEICHLLKEGESDKVMANNLNISANTVSNHLKNIYKRLGTKNRLGTLAYFSNKD